MAVNEGKAAQSQLAIRHRRKPNRKNRTQPRKTSRAPRITTPAREHRAARGPRAKARRRARRSKFDASGRVTTFPEVKGKVVREVRFSHLDYEDVLAIAFKDRTVLYFQVDPTPLVLPAEIRAHYIGERRSAAKTWEGLVPRSSDRIVG
jgi:hypothetical protein